MKKLLLASLTALTTMGAMAQKTDIFPKPQEVEWGTAKAFDNTAAYTLVGAADADADAVALLSKHFTTEGGTINLTIGERGDAAVAAYENMIPAKAEGYYLSVSADGVVIAGNDASGTYYGVQSYLQLAEQPEVQSVTVTDWPEVADRGLVEGYYGNPFSDEDRKSLFEFFGRTKMNVYIYGPKDDEYHRGRWREPYPKAQGERIAQLVEAATKSKVRFVWAMHPGGDIQWTDADRKASITKLEKMYALGVRDFAIFFDDIFGDEQSKGDRQAEYLNYLNENFVKKHGDVTPIIMCPTQYNRAYTGGSDTYLNALGSTLDKEMHIMWTGNSVVDMIGKDDMNWVNTRIKRNAYIWLNYPVTDYCIDHMLMGPTYGNDLNIASQLAGFTSNPMEYAEASKVSLYSIGDYCWNMDAYDANASWESAIRYLMPEHSEAFHLFCENNVDLGETVHGLRRTDESPRFVKARDEFNALMKKGDVAAATTVLRTHFTLLSDAAATLMSSKENPALVAEIKPWCEVMRYMALKGTELMNMYEALAAKQPEAFIESYLRYQDYDAAQSAVRSRDFEGSIKTPNPVVASYHIAPFLKATLATLVAEYKGSYDYRTDVFPAQEIENGTYFIMHEGKYLSNQSEGVAGTAPTFVDKRDDVKPQRQEWQIAIDPETGRYKIINMLDNRYLNELGQFTKDNSTNPYEPVWHTYYILRMANGKYCIQNGGKAGDKFWTVSNSRVVQSGSNSIEPDQFIFDLVPVAGEAPVAPISNTRDVYYIMDGDRYLTNTNPHGTGSHPIFKKVTTPGEAQEWRFTFDPAGKNHYKLTSEADGRYVNEHGVFGTNPYYADWNTYLILTMDGMCSIQITQSAASQLGQRWWNVKGDRLEGENLGRSLSYVIKIVPKGEYVGPDPEPGVLRQYTTNGSIDGPDYTALPSKVMPGMAFDVVLRGAPGYAAKGLTVRYGQNLDGAEFDAEGNRQWTETYVAAKSGKATIPAEMTEGDVNLYATFDRKEGTEWSLVFSDEFNGADKSQPTAAKWMRCQRYGATWNRWLSDSEEVIYLEDGNLVARAIPNPDKASDPVDMITGGIKSMGKFGFTYGYVEARIYNNLWIGNFPAFWMMPEDQSLGWPDCGEIDIWEVIDTQNTSYHTVHSNWTYDLGHKNEPQSSFSTGCSYDRYHTYGLEWTDKALIWYLDGKEVGRYTKSTNKSHLDEGQWPFDKHFHLILNQSVGNGAWAAHADITHTYETRFDWVRVYQKDGMRNTNGVVDAISVVEQEEPKNDAIYTLQGVRLEDGVENLPKGIYIIGGEKVVIK
ncbi:MAG: beta-N-acetylglucosaminidase domain-containing protein [Bacteroidaceae bacterium]|nr:beta-N-acetylglucosaminidase domain-containing protein [Bacteroidaceae bacterium]